jgi:hypothetical protein
MLVSRFWGLRRLVWRLLFVNYSAPKLCALCYPTLILKFAWVAELSSGCNETSLSFFEEQSFSERLEPDYKVA